MSTVASNGDSAKSELSAVFLFLDDIRNPEHAFQCTKQKMFLTEKWDIVRNFDGFKTYIETNGLPYFISFDHDLADANHTNDPAYGEKTGYDCAKWLVDYCIDNKLNLPKYYCHSMNPVGKDNILGLFLSFQKSHGYRIGEPSVQGQSPKNSPDPLIEKMLEETPCWIKIYTNWFFRINNIVHSQANKKGSASTIYGLNESELDALKVLARLEERLGVSILTIPDTVE